MNESDIRRIVREEIKEAFRVLSLNAESYDWSEHEEYLAAEMLRRVADYASSLEELRPTRAEYESAHRLLEWESVPSIAHDIISRGEKYGIREDA